MDKRLSLFTVLSLCLLASNCSIDDQAMQPELPDTLSIVSHTVIGTRNLDPEYGFADIRSICFGHDGSILVVDLCLATVRRYSPTGEYIMSYGQKGEGPGELTEPFDAAVDGSGNVWVSDIRGLNRYDLETGEWFFLDQRFTSPVLQKMYGNLDSSFSAMYGVPDLSGNIPVRNAFYALYSGGEIAVQTVVWTDSREVNITDSEYLRVCNTQPIITVDHDGNFYIAETSNSEFIITEYSRSGEVLLELIDEVSPVRLSAEEMEEERSYYNHRLTGLGMIPVYTPDEFWPAVSQ